jgi:sulfate adenylyltransferase subunit 2
LFSGGKDSILLVHLAIKAFWPAKMPFSWLHIDTGHNFEETLIFRDKLAKKLGIELVVKYVQDSINEGKAIEETGYNASRNKLQTITLLDGIEQLNADVAIGGGRRDEEKARAKERIFSHRDEFGQWDPKNQRPELWNIFNGRKNMGEHFRAFPISNWTELDVWQYILQENIELPNLYYTHKRKVFNRNGVWLAYAPFMNLKPEETVVEKAVRCRTIGDISCTGLSLSSANKLEDIVSEIAASRVTERGGRYDDKRSEAAMEDRKRDGYF